MIILGIALSVLATLMSLAGVIWLIVEGFKTSIGWGFGCLCCFPAQLIFVVTHWEDAKGPFFVWLGAFIPSAVGWLIMTAEQMG